MPPVRTRLAWMCVPAAALFGPMLLQGRALYLRDTALYFLPHRLFLARALLSTGKLPEWNPYEYEGMPLLVDPNFSAFHPFTWLHALWPTAVGYSALVAVCMVLASLGAFLLAEELDVKGPGRWVTAMTFAWCGVGVSLSQSGQFLALCSVPWLLLAVVHWMRAPSTRTMAGVALACALMVLAGTPEVGACAFVMAAVMAWGMGPLRRAGALALGGIWGALVAAAQLFPTAAFLSTSTRASGWSPQEAMDYSLHPLRLLDMVLPLSTSAPGTPVLAPSWLGIEALERTWVTSFSVGLLPVVLAVVGYARAHRGVRVMLVPAIAMLVVAMGAHTPVSSMIWENLALLRTVRFPEKLAIVAVVVPVALLAGAGLDALCERVVRGWLVGMAGAALVVAWVGPILVEEWLAGVLGPLRFDALQVTLLHALRTEGALLLGVLLLLWWMRHEGPPVEKVRWGLLALLCAELAIVAVRIVDSVPEEAITAKPVIVEALEKDAGGELSSWRVDSDYRLSREDMAVLVEDRGVPERVVHDLQREALYGALPMLHGVKLARGYSGFTSSSMKRLFQTRHPREMLALLGIRYGIQLGTSGGLYERLGLTRMLDVDGGRISVWRNALARTGVYATDRVVIGPGEDPLVVCPDGLRTWVSAEDAMGLPAGITVETGCGPGAPHPASPPVVTGFTGGEADLPGGEVVSGGGAVVVFAETFDPGWRVFVDDVEGRAIRVNGALRAVAVTAGTHRVRWEYRTPGLRVGMLVSLVAMLLLVVTGMLRDRPLRTFPRDHGGGHG